MYIMWNMCRCLPSWSTSWRIKNNPIRVIFLYIMILYNCNTSNSFDFPISNFSKAEIKISLFILNILESKSIGISFFFELITIIFDTDTKYKKFNFNFLHSWITSCSSIFLFSISLSKYTCIILPNKNSIFFLSTSKSKFW